MEGGKYTNFVTVGFCLYTYHLCSPIPSRAKIHFTTVFDMELQNYHLYAHTHRYKDIYVFIYKSAPVACFNI